MAVQLPAVPQKAVSVFLGLSPTSPPSPLFEIGREKIMALDDLINIITR